MALRHARATSKKLRSMRPSPAQRYATHVLATSSILGGYSYARGVGGRILKVYVPK